MFALAAPAFAQNSHHPGAATIDIHSDLLSVVGAIRSGMHRATERGITSDLDVVIQTNDHRDFQVVDCIGPLKDAVLRVQFDTSNAAAAPSRRLHPHTWQLRRRPPRPDDVACHRPQPKAGQR